MKQCFQLLLLTLFTACSVVLIATSFDCGLLQNAHANDSSPENRTRALILPPDKGLYLGQHPGESMINGVPRENLEEFESAIAKKSAFFIQASSGGEGEYEPPEFNVALANRAWNAGYLVLAWAYEATPQHGNGRGFTIDKLLNGKYDKELKSLAAQFREFGKPFLFSTAREPNGVLSIYMGGFGPDGDKSLDWAEKHGGLVHFDPSKFPNKQLYAGLGQPDACDGLERLAAAQRYYYDFFVNREKLHFINFDSMGWALGVEIDSSEPPLVKKCFNFQDFYPGNQYVDWVTVTYYGKNEDPLYERLERKLDQIQATAPGKPILFIELGLLANNESKADATAKKIHSFFDYILTKYPAVKGVCLWGDAFDDGMTSSRQIRPDTLEATAFKELTEEYHDKFHSCVHFSKGYHFPHCTDSPASGDLSDH